MREKSGSAIRSCGSYHTGSAVKQSVISDTTRSCLTTASNTTSFWAKKRIRSCI